jgi:hypothetical protein
MLLTAPLKMLFQQYRPKADLGLQRARDDRAKDYPRPALRLARISLDRGNASEPARHSESSGTDADRQRGIGQDAWIWRTWNFAALNREHTQGNVARSSIKEFSVVAAMVPAENAMPSQWKLRWQSARPAFACQLAHHRRFNVRVATSALSSALAVFLSFVPLLRRTPP